MSTDEQLQTVTVVSSVKRGSCGKFLGAKFDAKFHVDNHVKIMQSKGSNKIRALAEETACISIEEKMLLVNYFLVHNSATVN